MLTSKQRAFLRGMANTFDTILIIGKGEITENIIMQADTALTARELIKGKVLETSSYSSREAADILAEKCGADVVQVIGSKFVLYRPNPDEPVIVLPKAKKNK
ncbi:MAG TPA: ribosome assembly RNA-binding protein YhbY [Ruminococcaceae bacterium]|nr:ribosome assembly RNA-binding protein YhbY [Oscillospiraceae bacterium]